MDKNPKIKDEEISFIVQGALCDKTSEYIACIRKNFLGSEIILSTWQGTVVSEEVAKYCDKILLSKDPGGVPFSFPFGAVVYNNINRQIISTMAGLRAASRHYCVKIRTDFTLKSSDVVKFFNIYPRREQDALVYERRVIVPSIYSRVHLNGVPTPFHSSDFFAFGLKEDLILHFGSCPLQTQEELGEWQYKFPNRCPDPNCQWRFPPEQAFFYHAAKSKFPDIRMYDLTDLKADNIALSHKLMMNNFIFVNSDQIGLYSEKHNRCLAFSEGNFEYAIEHYKALMDLKYQEIPEEQWFDLGHMNTFFQSRAKMTTERAFNSIQINRSELWKSGIPQQKIIAESNWFRKIPADLRIFTPQYLGEKVIDDVFFYGLEYLYYLPLNELFVHGRNKVQFWENIYEKLIDVLSQMNRARIDSSEITKVSHDSISLYKDKTFRRVEEFKAHSTERQRFIWSRLDIDNIVKICIERSLNMPVIPSVIHGDFCFSNILFSSRSQQIKLIDPRGMNFNGEMTIFGDAKYDVAKLLHSAVGFYDLIIAQQYNISADGLSIRFPNKYHEFADFTLRRPFFKGVLSIELMPIVVLLFISMLPLHQDRIDRQIAFVLNAKRLFDQYVR